MIKVFIRYCLLFFTATPFYVWAHYPVMDCGRNGGDVVCQVGFSDGSLAQGQEVVVYSYSDEKLMQLTANGASIVRFLLPEGEFYIQFDAGHENPAEFDYVEL